MSVCLAKVLTLVLPLFLSLPRSGDAYCDCYGLCARAACGLCNQTEAKGCACYCEPDNMCYNTKWWDYCHNSSKSCSTVADMYSCDARSDCKWCSGANFQDGACHPNSYTPSTQQRCDVPLAGCGSFRTNTTCNADPSCKFCQTYEQGWTFCANRTDDHSGSATCDKSCSMVTDMYSCDSRSDCKWCSGANFLNGACHPNSYAPNTQQRCDVPLTGCGSFRTNTTCNADPSCKFCQTYEQGWTFCANRTDDHSGSATCDKSCSMVADMYSCDSRSDCKWCSGKDFSGGMCKPNAYVPSDQQECDVPATGCGSFRTKSACSAHPNCKFCREFEQGWTFCTNVTDDRHGDADCGKVEAALIV